MNKSQNNNTVSYADMFAVCLKAVKSNGTSDTKLAKKYKLSPYFFSNILYAMKNNKQISKTSVEKINKAFPTLALALSAGTCVPYAHVGKRCKPPKSKAVVPSLSPNFKPEPLLTDVVNDINKKLDALLNALGMTVK